MISKKFSSPVAAVLAASALSLASSSAVAAVICNNTGYTIPDNIDGIYLNLTTGASGTSGAGVDGFDINLFAQSAGLAGYPGNDVDPNNQVVATIVAGTQNDQYIVMTAGQPIGPGATFTAESAAMTNWRSGVTGGFLGVQFTNDTTSAVNFGWLQITTTAPRGFPATITSFCYDNTGAAINAGTTPVSLQKFSVD